MSYSITSFSPEFFFAEGEPYDGGPDPETTERPPSVWCAIERLRLTDPAAWADIARDVFGTEPQYLTSEYVLDKIRETNACRTLTTPVRVYIDSMGDYFVEVY